MAQLGKTYKFTMSRKIAKWSTEVDPVAGYGYFEHDEEGEGGGLWLANGELVDFDGRVCLPYAVGRALEILGYKVDEVCFAEERKFAEQDAGDFYEVGGGKITSYPLSATFDVDAVVAAREHFFAKFPKYRFAEVA